MTTPNCPLCSTSRHVVMDEQHFRCMVHHQNISMSTLPVKEVFNLSETEPA